MTQGILTVKTLQDFMCYWLAQICSQLFVALKTSLLILIQRKKGLSTKNTMTCSVKSCRQQAFTAPLQATQLQTCKKLLLLADLFDERTFAIKITVILGQACHQLKTYLNISSPISMEMQNPSCPQQTCQVIPSQTRQAHGIVKAHQTQTSLDFNRIY